MCDKFIIVRNFCFDYSRNILLVLREMRPIAEAFVATAFLPDTGVGGVGDDVGVGDRGAHRAAERGAEEGAGFDLA